MKQEQARIGTLIERNYKQIKSEFVKAFKKIGLDITTDQWIILDALNSYDSLSQNDLSDISYKNTATISRSIDLLVSKNLVTKKVDKNDRRKVQISLTKAGKIAVDQGQGAAAEIRTKIQSGITQEELNQLKTVLNKLYDNLLHSE